MRLPHCNVVTARQTALLGALAAIWGGSYLLIKYALEDFSAPMIVWARTAIAALVLLALLGGDVRGAIADVRARPRSPRRSF
jgi:drug/metabolite transporter (DMT)-like permease